MSATSLPLRSDLFPALESQEPGSPLGLATSLPQEHTYDAVIEGTLPRDLRGTLYRNGPGLFERAGRRKRNLLDGDGMIQAFRVQDGGVQFKNRFIRTRKYTDEEAAGRYLYATWTTLAHRGLRANFLGKSIYSQAAVSVIAKHGRLCAFDDGPEAYALDPETLDTLGPLVLAEGLPTTFAAHSFIDHKNGEWILLRGLGLFFDIITLDHAGHLVRRRRIRSPRVVYTHDFFVSDRHIILNLHPAKVSVLPFALGSCSFADALRWRPNQGNLLVVLDRDGNAKPIHLATEASWMWHSLNAYENGNDIIADFVGYRTPSHMLGARPAFHAFMLGQQAKLDTPGEIRRYIINLNRRTVAQEVLATENYEFPVANPHKRCHRHRFGYFARSRAPRDVLWSSVIRMDMDTGKTWSYDFGEDLYCGEPVFAPKPGFYYSPDADNEPGWLLTEVYDSRAKKSFLAILDVDRLQNGPIAIVHLQHHVPLSFHGYWHAERY